MTNAEQKEKKTAETTVHVKKVSGRTLTINCNTGQEIEKIEGQVEKRTKTPKAHQCLEGQGKTLKDKNTSVDCIMKEGTTIDMTLRLQGRMRNEEPAASSQQMEERQVKRRTSEPCSGISEISDVKVSDITEHLKREIDSASRRTDDRMELMLRAYQQTALKRMEPLVNRTNEMMLQTGSAQLTKNEHHNQKQER